MTALPAAGPAIRRICLVATEESGDRLGASLMKVLRQRLGDGVAFSGVGGRGMIGEGLVSLFPIEELSIVGFTAVLKQLPKILRLIRGTVDAIVASQPDVLVIIDSPDFTQRVAKRVRARDGAIPIVNYVAPTVWAWRPGGHGRCVAMSIMSSACCRSSPTHSAGSMVRPAPMSAIP